MFARSFRSMFAAAVVALSVVPAAAYADGAPANTPANKGTSHQVRQDKKAKETFPMATPAFKAKVETRIAKARERVAEHLAKRDVPAEKQKAVLARFDEAALKVVAEVDKVGASGTVTKEGAKDVRELARQLRREARDNWKQNHEKTRAK